MENKIINLAIKQMNLDNINKIFSQESFFQEYFKVFCENKPFDEKVIKSIKHDIDIETVIDLSNKLISIFEDKSAILSRIGIKNEIGLIIFIGNGNIDGHCIILDNYSYVFVDLEAIILRSNKNFNLEAFLSHELIHAVHYNLNKEFYPQNYKSIEDKYLKTLIAEGFATYMSMYLFGISENLGYWLGFLESDEVSEWICNCKKNKTAIGIRLKKLIINKEFDVDMYNRLFCIKSEEFTFYRIGYYYGCEIIRIIFLQKNISETLGLKFTDISKYINNYFKTVIL